MITNFILYNTADLLYNQIVDEINKNNNFKVTSLISINLKENYDNFFEDIYKEDNLSIEIINKKKKFVKENGMSDNIYVLEVQVNQITLKYNENKQAFVYNELQELKKHIRDKFKNYIPNYFHDILIHAPCCRKENELLKKVIRKYKKIFIKIL